MYLNRYDFYIDVIHFAGMLTKFPNRLFDVRPRLVLVLFLLAPVAMLAGCSKRPETLLATALVSNVAGAADAGFVETVNTTTQGFGGSAGEAVTEAIRLAIFDVNGGSMQSLRVSARYGPDLTLNQDPASLRTESFAELVRQRTDGVIRNFRVKELLVPSNATGERYRAKVEAGVARFAPSADTQIKVAIGAIRFDSTSLAMGDRCVASGELAENLRRRIGSALVQTGRFEVMDREAEADIVWNGRASAFAYHRNVRKFAAGDRELVSYSGGWALSEKLVSVVSRQVIVADWLKGSALSIGPATLVTGVDGNQMLQGMSADLVNQVVASIVLRIFPAAVVSRHGTSVVLSRGGQPLKSGGLYAMAVMGVETKDPQTGRVLGRVESPCCELRIERVTPNLSYGRLENIRTSLEQLPLSDLQLRHEITSGEHLGGAAEPAARPPSTVVQEAW